MIFEVIGIHSTKLESARNNNEINSKATGSLGVRIVSRKPEIPEPLCYRKDS